MLNELHRLNSFVLLILKWDVDVFEVVLFFACCFNYGYRGLVEIIRFFNKLAHLFELATDQLKYFINRPLLGLVVAFFKIFFGNYHNINIGKVEMEIGGKRTKNIDSYDFDFTFESIFNFLKNFIVGRLLLFVAFFDCAGKTENFFFKVIF